MMLLLRTILGIVIIFLACHQQLASAELLRVQLPTVPIQQDHVFRIRIESDQAIHQFNYPLQLQLVLLNGEILSNKKQCSIPRWEDLNQGYDIHYLINDNILAEELYVDINVIDAHNKKLFTQRYPMKTITSIKQRFNALVDAARAHGTQALQQLRLEQLALLLRTPLRQADFQRIESYLHELEQNTPQDAQVQHWPQLIDHAFTQTCDQSAQPLRLFIPKHQPRALIIYFRHYPTMPNKVRWPPLSAAALANAQREQCALLDIYPGGDRVGNGIYSMRCAAALKQCYALQANLRDLPHVIIAEGMGTRAAVHSIMHQDLKHCHAALFLHPVNNIQLNSTQCALFDGMAIGFSHMLPDWGSTLQAHRRLAEQSAFIRASLGDADDQAAWQWLSNQAQAERPATKHPQQIPILGQRPLICVVGSGEHLQAKQHINDLKQSLQAAWALHCQAPLPVIDDQQFQASDFEQHDLIFLGNPLDNQSLAQLLQKLPAAERVLRWDERHLHYPDGQALRSQVLQLRWHILHKQRHVWVLDGPALRIAQGPLPLITSHSALDIRHAGRVWSRD